MERTPQIIVQRPPQSPLSTPIPITLPSSWRMERESIHPIFYTLHKYMLYILPQPMIQQWDHNTANHCKVNKPIWKKKMQAFSNFFFVLS